MIIDGVGKIHDRKICHIIPILFLPIEPAQWVSQEPKKANAIAT